MIAGDELVLGAFVRIAGPDSFTFVDSEERGNTVWRYRRKEAAGAFSTRWSSKGRETGPGCFDFAILRRRFVESSDLLTVINKSESLRTPLRVDGEPSVAVDVGIEFKMAHIRTAKDIRTSSRRKLVNGLREDARKLAHEWPSTAYLLGFSHGLDLPDADHEMSAVCAEFSRICPQGDVRILLAARSATHSKGAWELRAIPAEC